MKTFNIRDTSISGGKSSSKKKTTLVGVALFKIFYYVKKIIYIEISLAIIKWISLSYADLQTIIR